MSELPRPQKKFSRIDWAIALALAALVVVTRIPFLPPIIADSDGAEYAFALEKFDMAAGYPHAPGYPLYILCAKSVYALTGDANISLVTVSVGFSALACAAMYLWGVAMFGRPVGVIAALLLLTENSFWRFGTMWRSVPSGVFWATVVALTAYRARASGGKWGMISAACLGLGGGFRQQVLTFLSFMWLWCCRKLGWKQLALGLLIIVILTAGWVAAVSWATGGYSVYRASSQAQWREAIYPSSVFFAAHQGLKSTVDALVTRITTWSNYLFGDRSHLSVLAWLLPLLYALGRLLRPQLIWSDERVQLLVAWLVPVMAFHLLVNMDNRSYVLIYLPPLCLIAAVGIYLFCADLRDMIARRYHQPVLSVRRLGWCCAIVVGLGALLNVGVYTTRIAPGQRQYNRQVQSVISHIAANYGAEEAALVQSDLRMSYHAVHYHLPEYPGYLLQQTMSPPRPSLTFPSPVRLDNSIRHVVFLNPQARVQGPTQTVQLDSGAAVQVVALSAAQRYMHFGPAGVWFSTNKDKESR